MSAVTGSMRWGLHLSVITGLAVLLSLGTWQVKRLAWKESLLASIETRMASPPSPLSEIEDRFQKTGDVDYYPVTLSGALVPGAEQYFLSTYDGQSGWNIYTPLTLGDGRFVMLNRGFVPYDRRDPATRPAPASGEAQYTGLARNPLIGKPSSVTPDNDADGSTWYWKDLQGMAAAAGIDREKLLPFFVDDWSETAPGTLPINRTTLVLLPNNHLQYAVTWYGLAAALLGVWAVFTFRRR